MEGVTVGSSQGPATGEEAELQLSTAAAHFPAIELMAVPGERGERSCALPVAALCCVTVTWSWQGAALPVLPGLALGH